MEVRADDDQKRSELRRGLQDRVYERSAGRDLGEKMPREGQQRLQAQFERAIHRCDTYQRIENGV